MTVTDQMHKAAVCGSRLWQLHFIDAEMTTTAGQDGTEQHVHGFLHGASRAEADSARLDHHPQEAKHALVKVADQVNLTGIPS